MGFVYFCILFIIHSCVTIFLTKPFLFMKKNILSAFVLGAFFVTGNTMAQVSFGPKIGLNLSSQNDKSKNASYTANKYESKIGYQIGGMLNVQINDYFAIRPELLFNSMGSKYSSGNQVGAIGTTTLTTNYLSLPVNFVGQFPISENFKFQAFVGPYVALGLGGKYISEYPGGNNEGKIKLKKDPGNNSNAYQNPLDFGLNFGIGFQAKSFVFSASYALGLTSTQSHYSDSVLENSRGNYYKTTNRNITFGVAYLFGGK